MLKRLMWVGVVGAVLVVAVVAGATPTNTTPPSAITGTPQVGATLSVTPGTYAGTGGADVVVADVWERCDDSAATTCVSAGAGGPSYVVVAADLGKYLRVAETASDGVDPPAGPIYTGTTAQIAAAPLAPQITTAPTISGGNLNVGQSLSRTAGVWSGNPAPDVTVAWQRCNDSQGNGCQNVGSGAATYSLVAADVSRFMRVRETAANGVQPDGHAESNVLGPVTQPLAPANPPAIDNTTPLLGQTITVGGNGTWTGFPQPTGFAYAWQRCDDGAGNGCVAVGTNANAYVVAATDVAKWIRVQVTATNGVTQAQSAWIQTAQVRKAPTNTALPTITSPALVFVPGGAAVTLTAAPGTWAAFPTPPSFAYEWQRCTSTAPASCAAFGAANQSTYTLQQADVGSAFRVEVTATNGVQPDGVAFTAVTQLVTQAPFNTGANGTVLPTITIPGDGVADRGDTITGLSGTWFASPAPVLRHQWQRCNAAGTLCSNVGAPIVTSVTTSGYQHTSSSTYAVSDADLGSRMKLLVTAQIGSGAIVSPTPNNVLTAGPVRGAPLNVSGQSPAVSGTLVRGQTLTATSGLWTGFWAVGQPPVAFTHQWQRCNATGGACVNVSADPPLAAPLVPSGAVTCTSLAPCGGTTTYLLSDADMGSTIRVIVKATNASGTTVELTTAPSAVVQGAPQILSANGTPDPNAQPKISGLAQSGLNIGASTGSWSAFPGADTNALSYAYQWVRCSGTDVGSCAPIGGATAAIYAVQDADVGQRLRIRITATNGVDPPGVAYSDPTDVVKAKSGGIGGNGVDLLLSAKASSAGGALTYTLTVTNAGNQGATGVAITANPPGGLTVVSATAPGGCSGAGPIICAVGGLGPGASAVAKIVIQATQTGVVSFSASAGAAETDVNPTNNSVSLNSFLVVTGTTPRAGDTATPAGKEVTLGPDRSVALNAVKLKASRVGKTWIVSTKFTLVSGNAKLQLVVTKNGSDKRLTLLKGSRLGSTTASASSTQLTLDTSKPATFPIKIVLPTAGFSLKDIYLIRITATSATGAASTLDLGFKGAKLISKRTGAKRSGAAWVAGSTFSVPAGKTDVQAWVTRGVGSTKATLLKGSRLGSVQAKRSATVLRLRSAKAGKIAIRVALSGSGFSLKQTYVIHVETKSSGGLWTDYEIRFKAPARALAGRSAKP